MSGVLKIRPADYERLRIALDKLVKANGDTLARVASVALESQSVRWTILFRAQAEMDPTLLMDLYTYLTDNHIDSAIRRVFHNSSK